MVLRRHLSLLFCLCATLAAQAGIVPARLTLRPASSTEANCVRLRDLVVESLPSLWAEIVVTSSLAPGQEIVVSRRAIGRALTQAGMLVPTLAGAESVRVRRTGHTLRADDFTPQLLAALARTELPDGVTAQRFEIEHWPALTLSSVASSIRISSAVPEIGSGSIQCELKDSAGSTQRIYVIVRRALLAVALHTRVELERDAALTAERVSAELIWFETKDAWAQRLAPGTLTERWSAARALRAGEMLARRDLRPTPDVRPGQLVDWIIESDGLQIRTQVVARGEGRVGDWIRVESPFGGALRLVRILGKDQVGEGDTTS